MKKVYSYLRFLLLVTCIAALSGQYANGQPCNVVLQGPASDPTCSYQLVSGGAGAFWTINVVNGVNYSFFVATSCGDINGACVNGSHLTGGTAPNPDTSSSAATGTWNIGFYESNLTWCGTSSTLSYKVTTPVLNQGGTHTATVCASNNTYTIPAGYSTTVGNISWGTSGDGTFTSGTTTTPTYNFGATDKSSGGLITLTMTANNGGCTGSTTFGLTINPAPTTATVGATQNLCGTLTSGALGGNSPSVGTATWAQQSGPGSSSFSPGATSPAANATASLYGSYLYKWTISNGICPSSSATVNVNYYPTPSAASVGLDQNICGSLTSAPLGGNTPASGTGTWTQTSGPGITVFGNANTGNTTATVPVVGTYQYTWTIASGTCPSTSATITVNYYATPTTATAGPMQNICGSLTSGALGGNTAVIGTGAWSEVSGPGTAFFSTVNSGSSTASVSAPGTYIFTWTITNGTCTSSANDTVNYYATPTAASAGATQNICGSLTSASLGGNTPLAGAGLWTQTSGPGTTIFSDSSMGSATATVSVVGNYVYTWTISNGTCAPSSALISVNFAATPTGGSIANTSYCASVGSGVVTVTGVSNATEYQWSLPAGLSGSSGTASITIGGSLGGTYTVTVTPIDTAFGVTCNGSPITGQVTILSLPVIDSVNTHLITCYGSSDDTIRVYATGSNGNLFYSIDGGTTYSGNGGVFTGISAGTYNVFVKDDSSCAVAYSQNPVRITQTAVPLSATSITTPVGCNGDSNGTINLLASGGAGGYLYSWSSGQNTQIISGLGAGTYVGTVTDGNGCIATVTDSLTNPTPIVTSISKTDVTCFGAHNGTASLTITGGVVPYTVLWDNFDTTSNIAHLGAGLYRVRVTDAYGCEHSDSIRIKRPAKLVGTLLVNNVNCKGSNIDSIVVIATGGNAGGYSYTWSPSVSTGPSVVDVAPGTYFVTVSDTKGCQFTDSATITEPLTALYATTIFSDVKCANDSNGTISVYASGGVGGYTYNWSSGQTIQIINGLPAGSYTVTVADANGCTVGITDNLVNPAPLVTGINGTNLTCNNAGNGQATVTANGGVAPYSILWNNYDTSYTIGGLSAGQYGAIITDANGCQQTDTVTITQPSALSATVIVTNIGCSGSNTGSVVVTVTGGTTASGTYSYSWSPVASSTDSVSGVGPGTYTVTASDDNACSVTASGTVVQTGSALVIGSTVSNITCNNDSNGAITVFVSGGSIGYTYVWSSGQATPNISGLQAGIYTVTVNSGTGCTATLSDTLVNPAPLVTTISGTNLTCYGSGNGQSTVTVSGGVAPYSILWNNYDTSYTAGGLSAGQYGAIITDANGCKQIDTIIITQPTALSASVAVTNIACSGGNTGTVVVNVSGGTPAYTYAWSSTGSTTDSVSGVGVGTYTVTVTDGNGCTITASGMVTQPLSNIIVAQQVTPVKCNSDSNGAINLTVNGGTGGYIYNWSSGQTTEDVSGLPGGTYTVSISDASGCVVTLTDTLVNPAAITAAITNTNVHPCYGDHNGTATLTANGGTGPLTVLWSTGDTTFAITHLAGSNTYTVVITDAHGCQVNDSIHITRPTKLRDTITVSNVLCFGSNMDTLSVSASGSYASGGYTYTWSPNVGNTPLITNVAPGVYYLTITDTAGCQSKDSAVITQPAAALAISTQVTNITCNNQNNGAITVTATGGIAPYTYLWTGGQTTATITGLSGGSYTVTVTDANGCSMSQTENVINPAPIAGTIAGTNVTCAGAANGSAMLTVTGGTGGYTFFWSNFDTSQNIGSLSGGLYRVIITDANGCKGYDSIIITEPQPLVATVTVRNTGCTGGNTGSVVVTVTGGTPAYTYAWSSTGSTTDSVSGVGPGTYTVTITDGNGCTITASGTVIQPASTLSAVSIVTDMTCHNADNGSITILASGGSGGYTYSWTGTAQTTSTITGLSAGGYTVTVTDGNGCTTNLTDSIHNPSAIVSSVTGTNVTCAGAANGSAALTVSGGTPGYTFLWSNFDTSQNVGSLSGGLYRVIISDANGCKAYDSIIITEPQPLVATVTVRNTGCTGGNTGSVVVTVTGGTPAYTYAWSSTGSTVDSVSGVGPGTYTVTITDTHGCSITASGTVIQPASTLTANSIVTDMTCHDADNGSISVLASGGSGGYTYIWTGTAQNTSTITGLSAGAYTVTVTDGNGCTISLTDTIHNPAAIVSSVTGTNVTCAGANNGTATLTVSGGASPYTFLWSNFSAAQNQDSLSGGWYYVIITDAHGCEHRDSVKIQEPQPLVVTDSVSPVSCANGNNGSIILTVSGGTPAYTYTWNPAGPNSPNNTGLAAGNYSVTVSDTHGCSATLSATLIDPILMTVSHISTNPRCNGEMNGTIDLVIAGGTPQYSYTWSPIEPGTSAINGLSAGTYYVTVADARGCHAYDSIVITQPSAMYVSGIQKNISCHNDNDGYILPTPYGGTVPYSFQWYLGNDTFAPVGPITENITNLAGGNYYLIVTDANGCMVPFSRTITNPDSLLISLVAKNLTCAGANSGSVAVVVNGGTRPYQFLWNNFTTDSTQTGIGAGAYTVIVTDSNGCHDNMAVSVTQTAPIAVSGTVVNPSCSGGNNGSISLTVSGGIPQYTYNWNTSPVQTTSSISGLTGGTYIVTVSDSAGCSQVDTFTLIDPATLYVNTAVSDPTCSGGDNGFVSLDVHGGLAPYLYTWSTTPAQSGNVASGLAAGTYYATITDTKGCMIYDTAVVVSPQPIVVAFAPGSTSCAGSAGGIVIVVASGGLAPYNYGLGTLAQSSDTFNNLPVGVYTVAVTDANGCLGTAPVTVQSIGTFTDTLTATPSVILAGETVQLYANASSDTTITGYTWYPADSLNFTACGSTTNCDSPTAMPAQSQYYTVTVTNARGCSISSTVYVRVSNTAAVFVPSAFTPNNDGLNDYFVFDILGATTINVQIWNRWGERVFSNPAQANGMTAPDAWDGNYKGKPVEFDTYTYQLDVSYYDGHTQMMSGTVVVMR
jgi:gliding motility-associated-like protein